MPQDAYTLRHLCIELNNLLKGSKVNRIAMSNNDEVVFTLYTGTCTKKLLVSVNPGCPRIGVVEREGDTELAFSNFNILLKKHLNSSTVKAISIVGFDRVVKIDFLVKREFSDEKLKTLYIELMGRYSNVILTEDGLVLGGNRGVNMFDDGKRPLFTGKPYVFPPDNGKLLPEDKRLKEKLLNKEIDVDLPQFICANVQGVALSTASEIVACFIEKHGDYTNDKAQEFCDFIKEFLYSNHKKPCVSKTEDSIDVWVYPYKKIAGEIKYFDSLFLAEEYYYQQKNGVKIFATTKSRLVAVISSAIKKYKKKLYQITSRKNDSLEAELNKIKGELLLANIYKIKGATKSVVLTNYYDGKDVNISLDENLSVAKNAENYYKKYTKQKRAESILAEQYEKVNSEYLYYEELLETVNMAENIDELNFVYEELVDLGIIKVQKVKKNKQIESYKKYLVDGFTVFVGRNNVENEQLLKLSSGTDIWLHAKDYRSSFVIIKTENKEVKIDTIIKVAEICAYHSRARGGGSAEIVYTLKKRVKKPSGTPKGFVTYTDFKSVLVDANKHDELLIDTNK